MSVPVRGRARTLSPLTVLEVVALVAWGQLWFLPTTAFEPFGPLFLVPPLVFLGLLAVDLKARRGTGPGTSTRWSLGVTIAIAALVALYVVVAALYAWTELIYFWLDY